MNDETVLWFMNRLNMLVRARGVGSPASSRTMDEDNPRITLGRFRKGMEREVRGERSAEDREEEQDDGRAGKLPLLRQGRVGLRSEMMVHADTVRPKWIRARNSFDDLVEEPQERTDHAWQVYLMKLRLHHEQIEREVRADRNRKAMPSLKYREEEGEEGEGEERQQQKERQEVGNHQSRKEIFFAPPSLLERMRTEVLERDQREATAHIERKEEISLFLRKLKVSESQEAALQRLRGNPCGENIAEALRALSLTSDVRHLQQLASGVSGNSILDETHKRLHNGRRRRKNRACFWTSKMHEVQRAILKRGCFCAWRLYTRLVSHRRRSCYQWARRRVHGTRQKTFNTLVAVAGMRREYKLLQDAASESVQSREGKLSKVKEQWKLLGSIVEEIDAVKNRVGDLEGILEMLKIDESDALQDYERQYAHYEALCRQEERAAMQMEDQAAKSLMLLDEVMILIEGNLHVAKEGRVKKKKKRRKTRARRRTVHHS